MSHCQCYVFPVSRNNQLDCADEFSDWESVKDRISIARLLQGRAKLSRNNYPNRSKELLAQHALLTRTVAHESFSGAMCAECCWIRVKESK